MYFPDPKSPKLSKTPPPSPADFLIKERAAAIQGNNIWSLNFDNKAFLVDMFVEYSLIRTFAFEIKMLKRL